MSQSPLKTAFLIKCSLFCLLLLHGLNAAGKEKSYFISAGVSASNFSVLDKGPSANTYSNTLAGFHLAYQETTQIWSDELFIHFQKGQLFPKPEITSSIDITNIIFSWYRGWKLNRAENWPLDLGFKWSNNYTLSRRKEYFDNSKSYCFNSSLGPAISMSKSILELDDRSWILNASVSMAIVGYVIRPSISSRIPVTASGNTPDNFFDYALSGRFASLGKFNDISTDINIEYRFKPHITFSLGYTWKYLAYKQDNDYYEVNHRIYAKALFRFK